jgi:hypothetical protein
LRMQNRNLRRFPESRLHPCPVNMSPGLVIYVH